MMNNNCPTTPINADCLCVRVALPDSAIGALVDFNWDGTSTYKAADLTPVPHVTNWKKRIFKAGDPVNYPLPTGVLYDAELKVFYFPPNFKIGSTWAIWTPPISRDAACGAWIWTASQLCVTFESGPCDEIFPVNPAPLKTYCLSSNVLTTASQGLGALQLAYPSGSVILSYDGTAGGQPSKFQYTGNIAPNPPGWVGDANLAAANWSFGTCVPPNETVTATLTTAQLCALLNTFSAGASAGTSDSVIVLKPTGCEVIPISGLPATVVLDNQVLTSPLGTLTITPLPPIGPDGQVNYQVEVSNDLWCDQFSALSVVAFNPVLPVQMVQKNVTGQCEVFEVAPPVGCPSGATNLALAPDFTFKQIKASFTSYTTEGADATYSPGVFDIVEIVANNVTITLAPPATDCDTQLITFVISNPSHTATFVPSGAFTLAGSPSLTISLSGPQTPNQGGATTFYWTGSKFLVL